LKQTGVPLGCSADIPARFVLVVLLRFAGEEMVWWVPGLWQSDIPGLQGCRGRLTYWRPRPSHLTDLMEAWVKGSPQLRSSQTLSRPQAWRPLSHYSSTSPFQYMCACIQRWAIISPSVIRKTDEMRNQKWCRSNVRTNECLGATLTSHTQARHWFRGGRMFKLLEL
jgi:hypothetical protein